MSNSIKCYNFVCENCNKSYSRKDNLNRHKKICVPKMIVNSNNDKSYFTKIGIEGKAVNPIHLMYLEDNPANHLKR